MFTGIIEGIGKIEHIEKENSNVHFTFSCPFTQELKVDQSLAHNGCCLTVVEISDQKYKVTAIVESLQKTNISDWQVGDFVNLERCMPVGGRLDGHMVQGHVDTTGLVTEIKNRDGSHLISIEHQTAQQFITVPQGSITLNGISLTVANSGENEFSMAIIPYTWEHTNLKYIKVGSRLNLEFDILGKYVTKLLKNKVR